MFLEPSLSTGRANIPLQQVKQVTDQEYRIVLLGRTGVGKSATGNAIFGEAVFPSCTGTQSQTSATFMHKKTVQGQPLLVVDTPGLFDTSKPNDVTKKEILKLLAVTAPGPHAIILVIPIHMRYTEEMRSASDYFKQIFGMEAQSHCMVIFTGADNLEADGMTFENYISAAPVSLTKLLAEMRLRYLAFDNRSKSEEKREDQVKNLLGMIRKMVETNGGRYFTNDSYAGADMALAEKDAKLVQQLETEKQRKLDKLRYPGDDRADLGTAGTSKHAANYQKQCALISEEINAKIERARQDLREGVIEEAPDVVVTEGWFIRAVKKVASALGYHD